VIEARAAYRTLSRYAIRKYLLLRGLREPSDGKNRPVGPDIERASLTNDGYIQI
jgi:hypothetical protein